MLHKALTKAELEGRIKTLIDSLNESTSWDTALIIDKVNQYYLTGTMQDGMLALKRDGTVAYFVRRSYERALIESPLKCIYPMESYRDSAKLIGENLGITLLETESITIGISERLKKVFNINEILPIDQIIRTVRSVKSKYELELMEKAGKIHEDILVNGIPGVLREGMSEAELAAELFKMYIEYGSQGISRFYQFQTEMFPGQICFGESSIYPSYFDGPGSMIGMSPAIPIIGSRDRLLRKGDLIYIDVGCDIDGYNTDKTQIYIFGERPSKEITAVHRKCKEILDEASDLLRPNNVVSDIYNSVISKIEQPFLDNFMGFGQRIAKFLGHGVGLHVDEVPVITSKVNTPLKENMVIALEPKKGIAGRGMVGVEETFIVTPNGGKCITGGAKDIIAVKA